MIYQINSSNEQSESSCSECKRNAYQIKEQEEESYSQEEPSPSYHHHNYYRPRHHESSSSESKYREDIKVAKPLRNRIVGDNYHFEHSLNLLRTEVETLKQENIAKDKLISELTHQVQSSIQQDRLKAEMQQQSLEIKRMRQQLGCSPRHQHDPNNVGKVFQTLASPKGSKNIYQSRENLQRQSTKNMCTDYMPSQSGINSSSYENSREFITTIDTQGSLQLKIALLEKEVREYQFELVKVRKTVEETAGQIFWMQKFITSFVKMAQELSLTYGNRLHIDKFPFKKQTKVSWSYIKDLISYFLKEKQAQQLGFSSS